MEKTRKSEIRDSIRMWSTTANHARHNMFWWFGQRHEWQIEDTPEQSYNYCYQKYKNHKRSYKKARERIVYWTNKYLAEYKG